LFSKYNGAKHPRLMPWMEINHGKYGILIAIFYGKLNARIYGKVLAVYIIIENSFLRLSSFFFLSFLQFLIS